MKYLTSLDMTGIEVITLGSSANITAAAKAEWVTARIETGNYDSVVFLDDSARNIEAMKRHHKIKVCHVFHGGIEASKFH